ncbi:MAG: glycosyltransferase, partial [Anaerolineales bacterium]|nr:glycosyltransferase [Anaerolineales bacterium]
MVSYLAALITSLETTLVLTALFFGIFFFVYGLKYYLSVALILFATSGSGNGNANGNKNGSLNGRLNGWLNGKRNGRGNGKGINGKRVANGGNGRIPSHLRPFVSIHLPLYNEMEVVDRLLTACTSLDYENYEIIVADDSTDETTQILHERWESHPRVKISHRVDRSGFKGGALKVATQRTNPEAEFIVVFDADFVPPPDIIHQFLSYFYGINGSNGNHYDEHTTNISLLDDLVAVVQGYQWHMLNASENWITRGVRSEFSGSYVIERSGQEMMGSMKMISGSVFMIRADVLRQIGWKTSITEDWELTLRLYLEGYKVLYTPFIQAPAECVATFAQLTQQRMRWAEGHTFNVKKYFLQVLSSTKINLREKLEFMYYAPYYLQSVLFLLGTGAWLISDFILKARLPFWTKTLGWSLVFVNAFSLVLMNLSGL